MKYKEPKIQLPHGMRIGSKVGIVGEGNNVYEIVDILYNKNSGNIRQIVHSGGFYTDPKDIYLLNDKDHWEVFANPDCNIKIAVGECDICGLNFYPSDSYHTKKNSNGRSMICASCFKSNKKKKKS